MHARSSYDAIVVGASIAGCTTATLLGREGLRVALIERHSDPNHYKRTCTHFIQPCGRPVLDRLAASAPLEAAGAVRNSLDVWTRWGWIHAPMSPDHADAFGYTVRRSTLDPLLRRIAADTAGVDLFTGATMDRLDFEQGRAVGVGLTDRSGTKRSIRGRVVVGADGRDSRTARLGDLPERRAANGRFMYIAYFEGLGVEPTAAARMWLLEPDTAIVAPCDGDLAVVSCGLSLERLPEFRADREAAFAGIMESLPEAPPLRQARRVSPLIGKLDMTNHRRKVNRPGLALVGDAAMAGDPVWAVGCGWALRSAEMLAEAVTERLCAGAGDRELDRALSRYGRRHRRVLGGHYAVSSNYSTGRSLLPHERMLLSAAARDGQTARSFASFGEGLSSAAQLFSPRTLGRAIGVNLRNAGAQS